MKNINAERTKNRRSFLRSSLATGAAIAGATALGERKLFGQHTGSLNTGDVAILKFLAAAELIEADLWQYISSNTLDEQSHAEFLNAYLISKGEEPVDLDRFRTLPSSTADGADQIGRLTNLTPLKIDTSWYTRYPADAAKREC